MVYTTPPRNAPNATLGNQLGQGISQGFLESFKPAAQQQYQRGQLQKALEGMKQIANDPKATPYDIASALISTTSQIPGSERYVGQLYDSLMRSRQTRDFFDGQGESNGQQGGYSQGNLPQNQMSMQSGGVGSQGNFNPLMNRNEPVQQPSPLMQNQGMSQGQQIPGETPALNTMSDPEMRQEARRQARALNDPTYEPIAYQNLVNRNNEIRQQQKDVVNTQALETQRQADIQLRDNNLRNFVTPKLKTDNPEEINDFMLIGQRYENLKNNPSAWYDATKRDFDNFMRSKTALEGSRIPGIMTGILRGGKERELALKRIDPIVKDLISIGKEDYARQKLADFYLSPTEIEEKIHPLPKQVEGKIKSLPRAPYEGEETFKALPLGIGSNAPWDFSNVKSMLTGKREGKALKSYDELLESNPDIIEKTNQKLSSFIKDNLTDDGSLLVLRDKLQREKGYDWRQFLSALDLAEQSGLKLNGSQKAERAELTRAPIQSLPDLFSEWFRWIDYLRGNK